MCFFLQWQAASLAITKLSREWVMQTEANRVGVGKKAFALVCTQSLKVSELKVRRFLELQT